MTARKNDDALTRDDLVSLMCSGVTAATVARAINAPEKQYRDKQRGGGVYVSRGGAHTAESAGTLADHPWVRKHAEAAGYVYPE